MEGIGYWFFIAVLYLLSSLMKKRQQKTAREKLDDETISDETEQGSRFKFDFLKEIYNEFQEASEEDLGASYGESDIDEDIEPEWVEPEPIAVESREQGVAVFDDLSSRDILHEERESGYELILPKQAVFGTHLFQSADDLKRAVIMKEVLDKPRALRRSIR